MSPALPTKLNFYFRFEGYISVEDIRNTVFGTLRNERVLQADLVYIINNKLNDKQITVVRLRRKYRNEQKVKITIHVQSSKDESTVRGLLKDSCKRFKC